MNVIAEIEVRSGPHERSSSPIRANIGRIAADLNYLSLISEDGVEIPAQFSETDEGVEVAWILERAGPFDQMKFFLVGERPSKQVVGLRSEMDEEKISVFSGSELVMCCYYADKFSKPFLFPLNGPTGAQMTWNASPDHVHHRSIWVGHGEVNGHDLWSELPDHGVISLTGTPRVRGGPMYSEIQLPLTWRGASGERLLDELRTVRLWNIYGRNWLVDHDSSLSATYCDVHLGDTKEAGGICVRVRESIEVENGGRIENSWGAINESEAWGKRANWCDYSGPVEGSWQGIAIFDHIMNPRHPTYWHVRDYGLMAANVFGATAFGGREDERGGILIRRGESLSFRYRIYVHVGDARSGNVASKYVDYVYPPEVSVVLK